MRERGRGSVRNDRHQVRKRREDTSLSVNVTESLTLTRYINNREVLYRYSQHCQCGMLVVNVNLTDTKDEN